MGRMKNLLTLLGLFCFALVRAEPVIDPFAEEAEQPPEEMVAEVETEVDIEDDAGATGEEPVQGWKISGPMDARVALRGDRVTGLGTLAIVRDRPVVVTSLQAIDGNSQLEIRLPNGTSLSPVRIIASTTGALALIEIEDPERALSYIEIDLEERPDIREGQTVAIPVREDRVSGDLLPPRGPFFPLNRFTGEPLPGSPVVSSVRGRFVGVFAPQRQIFTTQQAGRGTGGNVLHEAGVLVFSPELRWEPIDWVFFRDQRRQLDEFSATTRAVAGFLANRREEYAHVQPLVAAQRRFSERRNQSGFDLTRERDSLIFTISSQASANVTTLERDIFQLYGYFQPEAEMLLNERRRLINQVQELRRNPASVDRFAR